MRLAVPWLGWWSSHVGIRGKRVPPRKVLQCTHSNVILANCRNVREKPRTQLFWILAVISIWIQIAQRQLEGTPGSLLGDVKTIGMGYIFSHALLAQRSWLCMCFAYLASVCDTTVLKLPKRERQSFQTTMLDISGSFFQPQHSDFLQGNLPSSSNLPRARVGACSINSDISEVCYQ